MLRYLSRRLLGWLVLVGMAASLAFVLAAVSLDPRSNYEGRSPAPPPQVVDQRLEDLNLNDKTPLLERYARWAGGVLQGDFGRTWDGASVNAELGRRIGVSLRLLLVATIVGAALGILAGAWSATRRHRLPDHALTIGSFVILATPVFVLAVLLQIAAVAFNDAVGARVLLYTGEFTPGLEGGTLAQLGDRLRHLVLPSLTLILAQIAIFSRYQRNAMLDVLESDFVRTARAKGLRRRTALRRHALRAALIPTVTLLAYDLGLLLVGATFTEKIFGWHGMGAWFVDSVTRQDVNAVAAVTCVAAVLVLIAGLLSDAAYAYLDPRVRVR
ncbi:MAG TPA: ABC transporter permease [Solirubrobacteraceae bacterium]|jgi:peptide/nickel transport system permease protein|nr:ABC transporter permease [Solirubrobacteraceae bacterium]